AGRRDRHGGRDPRRQRRARLPFLRQADPRRLPPQGRRLQGAQVPAQGLREGHRLMAAAEQYTPRLKERYDSEVKAALIERFAYTTPMQAPRIQKITLNMGVGEAKQNAKSLDEAVEQMGIIAGQKPLITKATKSIAGFKLREGMAIGCKVTLRGAR